MTDDDRYLTERTLEQSVTVKSGDTQSVYVSADEFMDVQAERDHLRRSMALVNEALHGHVDMARALRVLDHAGFTARDAAAVSEVIAFFSKPRGVTPTERVGEEVGTVR